MSAETHYGVIVLDRPRPLRYTVRSIRLVEDRSRRNLGELLIEKAGLSSAVWLIWGALITDDKSFKDGREPDLSVDDVSDLLQEHWFDKNRSLPELGPYYNEAFVSCGVFSKRDASKKDGPEVAELPAVSGSPTGSNA
jgi:hypothetical protein